MKNLKELESETIICSDKKIDYNKAIDDEINTTHSMTYEQSIRNKAIDDLLYKMLEKGIIYLYQYNEMYNFAEQTVKGR